MAYSRAIFYIYILVDPTEPNIIRYVGKTNNLHNRFIHHKISSRKKITHKDSWIKSITDKGLEPEMIPIDTYNDEQECYDAERYWVEYCRKMSGKKLTNHIGGGRGCFCPDEIVRKKLSESHKGKESSRKGKSASEQAKQRLSEAYYMRLEMGEKFQHNKPHSEESKNKMSESHKGRTAWNKGIKMTNEQIKNNPIHLRKMPARQKGYNLSPEHIESLKRGQQRRWKEGSVTEETSRKLSESITKSWIKRREKMRKEKIYV